MFRWIYEFFVIVLISILAAIFYGILHDLITTRVSLEYFTIGHADVFHTTDPTTLALGWGVIATWWVGLIMGVPLAMAAQFGLRPPRCARSLILPLLKLLGVMAVIAALVGITGFLAAGAGWVHLSDSLEYIIPPGRREFFLAVWWTHMASYATGFLGGVVLIAKTWDSRKAA